MEELLDVVSIIVAAGTVVMFLVSLDGDNYGGVILAVVMFLVWMGGDGYEKSYSPTEGYTETKTLVSTAPSHTQLSGGFTLLWGSIGTDRVYLLREEVSEGLYKDFEVRREVYLREDTSLTDRGTFTKIFSCEYKKEYYELLFWKLFERERKVCNFNKQEIAVPVGSVIKNLSL